MSEKIVKIKWRESGILPLGVYGHVSKSVIALTNKGHIVLSYDHLLKCWFDPQQPQQEFKGTVLKWCNLPE